MEKNIYKIGKELFITNDEEIKKGDWFLFANKEVKKADRFSCNSLCKKIILTTDRDLIKDGVQAIDDEFLEWFVKNPSCERVEVNKLCYGALSGFADAGYKINLLSEEPKQERSYSEEDLDAFRKFMIQEQNFSKSCLDVFVKQFKKK